jgi:hypothetical protein
MKTKEVIVLAFLSRPIMTPLLLTYENESMYLHIDQQGCALFREDSPEPIYRNQEPLLLAQGIMTDSKTVHLVVLKANGELCYTLISDSGIHQTSLLARLDVRATRYRRLFLFPKGKLIHIFYAYSNQAIPDLWRIEHRFWDGASWRSVHMGEVVHPREPLYHVNLDSQGNIHLLTMTFQGRYSLLFSNRFNGVFHIWGSPTETLKVSGEVVDMAALMTSDNVNHLFWAVKNPTGQIELRWAQQTDAHELASTWQPSPAPIKTFSSPWKRIGALERNGIIWLLAHAGEEILMLNDGKGWKLISSHTSINRPLQWVHKGEKKNYYQTYWLEDQVVRRAPAYYQELGFTIKKQSLPMVPFQPIPTQAIPPSPPPVPALSPELSPKTNPLPQASIPENELNTLKQSEPPNEPEPIIDEFPITNKTSISASPLEVSPATESSPDVIPEPQPIKENAELQSLISSVAHLEQENTELQSLIPTVARLEQENTELQSLIPTVARLEQENTELQSLFSTVTHLEQENAKLQSLFSTVTHLEQENAKLQSLFSTVTHLEQENAKLQSIFFTVARLEQENTKLQSLSSIIAHLKQENTNLSLTVNDMLSKFDQILEVIAEKDRLTEQEAALLEESREAQTVLAPLHELEPFKEAMSNLELETQSLSQVLRVMLTKQEESESSINKLESQICQLQEEQKDVKNKGGFWNKWIT